MPDPIPFPEIGGLSPEEAVTLIRLFVTHCGVIRLVKQDFWVIGRKKLSLELLSQFKSKYEKEIDEHLKKLLANQELIPMARKSYRFMCLQNIYEEASRRKKRGMAKVGPEQVVWYIGPDAKTQLSAVQLAETMDYNTQKLEIDRARAKLDPEGVNQKEEEDKEGGKKPDPKISFIHSMNA